jgi:flavin-dependent dehydrogenase
MKIVVVGSGLIGLTTAYFLRCRGHEVTVIERRAGPRRETSFANEMDARRRHEGGYSCKEVERLQQDVRRAVAIGDKGGCVTSSRASCSFHGMRTTMLLHRRDGFSLDEIGTQLGISVGSTNKRDLL